MFHPGDAMVATGRTRRVKSGQLGQANCAENNARRSLRCTGCEIAPGMQQQFHSSTPPPPHCLGDPERHSAISGQHRRFFAGPTQIAPPDGYFAPVVRFAVVSCGQKLTTASRRNVPRPRPALILLKWS